MKRTGLEYVDPIQQGIKTFATLKEIDRQDMAEERAGRAESRANEELTLRKDEASRQAASHGIKIEADQLALGEQKKALAQKAMQEKLAPLLARVEQYKASNNGSLKGFKDTLAPEEVTVIGEAYGHNPTFSNTSIEQLPMQTAALDVIHSGAAKFATQFQGKQAAIDGKDQPDILEAFNLALGQEINKGGAEGGNGVKRAQTIYLNGDGTFSLDLAVDTPDKSYVAPLTDIRGPEGQNVRKIPLALTSQYARANATHGKLALMALERDPEGFFTGLSAAAGDKAPIEALRKQNESIATLRATHKLDREEKDALNAKVKEEADKVAPQVSAIIGNKKLSAEEKKAQLVPLLAGLSPEAVDRLSKTNSTLTSLVPKKAMQHVTTGSGVFAFDPETGQRGARIGDAPKTGGAAGGDDSLNKAEKAKLQELDHKYNRASIAVTANQGRLKDVIDLKEKTALQAAINADLQLMQNIENERATFWQQKGMGTEKPKASPAAAGLSGGFQLPDGRIDKRKATGAEGVYDATGLPADAVPAGFTKDGRPAFKLPNGKLVAATITK